MRIAEQGKHRWIAGILAMAVVGMSAVAVGVSTAPEAAAAPGAPGIPQAPVVLYSEDFERASGLTLLPNYVSASGETYTADSYWLNTRRCNGFILNEAVPTPDLTVFCNNLLFNWTAARAKADVLGLLNTPQNPASNYALSSNSAGAADNTTASVPDGPITPPNGIQFATASQITLPASNRFVTFSAAAAATGCSAAGPLLRFYLRNDGGTEIPVSTSAINPCTDPRSLITTALGLEVRYGNFAANDSLLLTGNSLGVVLRNEQAQSNGNDGAVDNIRVLDVTPQLDMSFTPAVVETGGVSTLTFTITNTSELAAKEGWSLTNALPAGVVVSDSSPATTSCLDSTVTSAPGNGTISATGSLGAGQTSCTITVPVTSAAPGVFTNPAASLTLVGLNAPNAAVVAFESPGVTLQKTAGTPVDVNGNGVIDTGDTIPYTFDVENTGDVELDPIAVDDPIVSVVDCPSTSLASGASLTCTGEYTVTDSDVTARSVANTATASGRTPAGEAVVSDPSSATVAVGGVAALTLDKSVSPAGPAALVEGQEVTYTFLVSNTGEVPVSDIDVTETDFTGSGSLSTIDCPSGTVAPGEDVSCTATYTLTQADVDAGVVSNTAVATGTPPSVIEAPTSDPSTATLEIAPAPALQLVKSALPSGPESFRAGQEITYAFDITNSGNVTVADVGIVEESFSGFGSLSPVLCPAGSSAISPGDEIRCTATYLLTQQDIDAGFVTNTARAEGATQQGGEAVSSDASTFTIPSEQNPALSLRKSADRETVSRAGETIVYTFVAVNTGDVVLRNVTVVEGTFTGTGRLSDVDCGTASRTLAPGEELSCRAEYRVTDKDIVRAEPIENTATAEAATPMLPANDVRITSDLLVASAPSTARVDVDADAPLAETGGTLLPTSGLLAGFAAILLVTGMMMIRIVRRRGAVEG